MLHARQSKPEQAPGECRQGRSAPRRTSSAHERKSKSVQSGSCQHSAAHSSCDSAVMFCTTAPASSAHTCHGEKSVWPPLGAPFGDK